jgi:Mg-chelatase subunit ChlD
MEGVMRSSLRLKLARVFVGLTLLAPVTPVETVAAVSCSDVHVIWVRGANLGLSAFDHDAFVTRDLLPRIGAPVTTSEHELGDPGFGGFTYVPADSAALFQQGLGIGDAYQQSVAAGRSELNGYLTDRAAQCGNEVYVLGGYSEGADVIGSTLFDLPQTVRNRIAFVALFGDPKLDTGNNLGLLTGIPLFPPGCVFGRPWMRGSAPCWITGGIFESREPYLPTDIQDRVGSWCRDGDAACNGSWLDIVPSVVQDPPLTHSRYFDPDAESAMAAREAAERLATFVPAHSSSFDVSWDQFVVGQSGADLVIVFDTTGSMSGAISDAKTQAANLAQQWTTLFQNGRVGLVEFKDQGDPFVSRVDLGLTSDAAAFQTAVNALSATGGGDTPEAQLSGIMTALDGMAWANGATKAVVVITDATGKDPEPVTNFTRNSVDQHALQIDPVAIYGVNVSTLQSVADWMTPMATATAGDVVTLAPGQSLSDALSSLFDSVHANPVAKLDGPIIAQTNTAITFSAADSFDASAAITNFKWDFDGNGTVDRTTTTPATTYTYPGQYVGIASVEVVAADGRSALATTDVRVDSVGLGNVRPIAPTSVTAIAMGSNQATVSWTPAANDRADAYKVYLANGTVLRFAAATDPHSLVIGGLDLSQPIQFYVAAWNAYGHSAATAAPPIGGAAWTSSVKVNDDVGTTQQERPAISLGADGATYLIWDDYRSGNQADIYFSRRNPATGTWGANQKVNNDTSGRSQWSPSIAVDGSNNAYAVWQDQRNGNKTPDDDIYFSKRSAAGTWSSNVRVNNDTQGAPAQYAPQIAVKADGAALAVWVDRRSNQWNIYSSRLAAGASTWAANIRVTTNTASRKLSPDVVVGPDGTAYAVWEDDSLGNYDIWFSKLPPGSSTWTLEAKISDDPGTAAQYSASIGIDATGNLLVTWLDDRPYPSTQARSSRLPAGTSTWPASRVVSDAAAVPVALALSVKSNGNGYAVWQDARGPSYDIWGSYYDAGAGAWATATLVSDDPGTTAQKNPAVAINNTEIAVAWNDHRADTVQGDIYARRRTPS